MSKILEDGTMIIDTKEDINMFRLLAIKGRLKMELGGLKFRTSTHAMVKREFGFKGNRQKVYDQFCEMVEKLKKERTA